MEFDNRIRLKDTGSCEVRSDLAFEDYHKKLWDLFHAHVQHLGDGGNGEFWLDYPAPLRTRHLVVNLEEGSEPGRYRIRFRGGSKPDYLCDVLVMVLALAAFWCLGKLFVPGAPVLAAVGCVAGFAAAAGLYIWSGKGFGGKETLEWIERIKR
ncbi:MAG: hypothetical protein IJ255_05485 [Bacteroidales bacterium]|nr:hypothetical protein [Bacteroidales bacterium]